MPNSVLTSIVFVGGEFPINLFNERDLIPYFGAIDTDGLVKVGPVGQFSYSSRKFQFSVTPDRIDLKCSDVKFVPQELMDAAHMITNILTPIRAVVRVSGFGINCDAVFGRSEIGSSGSDFCRNKLINAQSLPFIGDSDPEFMSARYILRRSLLRLDVRVEPHFSSGGERLFVAINGHQDLSQEMTLEGLPDAIVTMQEYVSELYGRILMHGGDENG